MEIEVSSEAGFNWGGSLTVNFGTGGWLQLPISYKILLKNSVRKPIEV